MTVANETPRPKWASAITTPKETALPKSIFLYSPPGTRKTSISSSIAEVPGFNRVLMIDMERGAEVIAQNPLLRDRIDVLEIDPLESGAKAKLDAVIDDIYTNDYGYDAVILDTLDVAQDVAEKWFKANNPDPKNTFRIYGDLGVWTDEIVRKLHSAKHFTAIITCHSTEQKAESGAYRILPRLSGSSKDAIGGIFSIVAHLSYGNHPETGERHLLATVGESDTTIAKNRFGLNPVIVDLTMPKLYQLINERVGKPAPAQTATKEEQQ